MSFFWVFLLNVFGSALFLKGKNLKISEPVFDPEGGWGGVSHLSRPAEGVQSKRSKKRRAYRYKDKLWKKVDKS